MHESLTASAAGVTLVWCGHDDGRLWPVVEVAWNAGGRRPPPQIYGRLRSPTSGIQTDARWR